MDVLRYLILTLFVIQRAVSDEPARSRRLRRNTASLRDIKFEIDLLKNTLRIEREARMDVQQKMTGIETRLGELKEFVKVPGRTRNSQVSSLPDQSQSQNDVYKRNIETLQQGLEAEKVHITYLEDEMVGLEALVRGLVNSTGQTTYEPPTCCQNLNATVSRIINLLDVIVKEITLDNRLLRARIIGPSIVKKISPGKRKALKSNIKRFLGLFKPKE